MIENANVAFVGRVEERYGFEVGADFHLEVVLIVTQRLAYFLDVSSKGPIYQVF